MTDETLFMIFIGAVIVATVMVITHFAARAAAKREQAAIDEIDRIRQARQQRYRERDIALRSASSNTPPARSSWASSPSIVSTPSHRTIYANNNDSDVLAQLIILNELISTPEPTSTPRSSSRWDDTDVHEPTRPSYSSSSSDDSSSSSSSYSSSYSSSSSDSSYSSSSSDSSYSSSSSDSSYSSSSD